jgi:hypothetical protein
MREPFSARVQQLHDGWVERRALAHLASDHDFDAQFHLLVTLHEWAEEAFRDIAAIYEGSLALWLSPAPRRDDSPPAFTVRVGEQETATFALSGRSRVNTTRWHVSASIGAAGGAGRPTIAGPERSKGQWSRSRLEDLLLSLVSAYERSLGAGDDGPRLTVGETFRVGRAG